jgi:hypothetical protein
MSSTGSSASAGVGDVTPEPAKNPNAARRALTRRAEKVREGIAIAV